MGHPCAQKSAGKRAERRLTPVPAAFSTSFYHRIIRRDLSPAGRAGLAAASSGPSTVYRALDLLLQQVIHKVETSSAFISGGDIDHPHESQFMICDDCGATEEIRDRMA